MLTYVGELTIAAALPAVVTALGIALADVSERYAALQLAIPLPVPPDFNLGLATSILAGIQANISIGIVPPSIDLQISLFIALIAELAATLGIVVNLQNLLASAGVHVYVYDGRADTLGGDLTTALSAGFPGGSGGAQHTNAIVLATTVGATWSAMSAVFKVTP